MPRVILLLVIIFTLVILVRRAQQQPPHKRRAAYLQIIVGSAVIGVIILTLMGKMHWVGAALTGVLVVARQLLPVLVRLLPALGGLRASGVGSSSKESEVSSRIIKMTLNHDSGELNGVVLESTFKGWFLSELDRQQLDELLSYCQHEDTDSAQLLTSYLEQRFPDDARDSEDTDRGGGKRPGPIQSCRGPCGPRIARRRDRGGYYYSAQNTDSKVPPRSRWKRLSGREN